MSAPLSGQEGRGCEHGQAERSPRGDVREDAAKSAGGRSRQRGDRRLEKDDRIERLLTELKAWRKSA